MTYLLDTSTFSDAMREDACTLARLNSVSRDDNVVTCSVVRGEILFGISRLARGRRRADFEAKAARLFSIVRCEPVPPDAGDRYAEIRFLRESSGVSIDANDAWIAATALALGATLVTRDSDYQGIPALALADWSR